MGHQVLVFKITQNANVWMPRGFIGCSGYKTGRFFHILPKFLEIFYEVGFDGFI
jgi:hypothetical protein